MNIANIAPKVSVFLMERPMNLYPHQLAALAAVKSSIKLGRTAGLIAMPTGTGKTVIFCKLGHDLGWPTLILVHRGELVTQTIDTLEWAWPLASTGVIKGPRDERDGHDAVVASVASLHSGRLERMPRDRFGLIVVDEAHHAAADSWVRVLDHFDSRFILGCTATPDRFDGRSLADRFGDKPLFTYQLRDAIEDGQLARLTQCQIRTDANLDGVAYRMGDYAEGALSLVVNTPAKNRVIVEAFNKHAPGRRAIAFCVDVRHATDLAETFQKAGIRAECVTGTTPIDERRQLLADFAAGDIQVMANCQVLTEGFDDPSVDCILMARPTASRGLYTQCLARGLRKFPNKSDCLVLDITDNAAKHKLVTVMDLLGALKTTDAAGSDVLEMVDRDIRRGEQSRIIASRQVLTWRLERVCPWPELPTLRGYVPIAPWHNDAATTKQVDYINNLGLAIDRELTKGECGWLIDRALQFEAAFPTPATYRQQRCLRYFGAWEDRMSKRDATKLIGELKSRPAVA